MAYRKLTAGKIFDGNRLLTGHMLVTDDKGRILDLLPVEDGEQELETYQGILSPGFVNCHCHLELSHMKGRVPEKTGLVDFVFKIVTERHHPEQEILEAIEMAEEEMYRHGIIAVGDICNNTSTINQKNKGRLLYYNFIEASGWLPSVSEKRMQAALDILDAFKRQLSSGDQRISIVPHAPYSVSGNLWVQIQPHFQNKVVSIHNQETAFEDEFFLKGSGDFNRMYQLMKISNEHHVPTNKTSLQSYYQNLLGAARILLVHNTFTTQADLDFIQLQTTNHKPQTFFCLCINANQYIEQSLPPVELLRKNNCQIVLGTDSLASNWSLNIMDEIRTLRENFAGIPLEEMLKWATINGARALGMDDAIGRFEKGKQPGIVLVNESALTSQRIL